MAQSAILNALFQPHLPRRRRDGRRPWDFMEGPRGPKFGTHQPDSQRSSDDAVLVCPVCPPQAKHLGLVVELEGVLTGHCDRHEMRK